MDWATLLLGYDTNPFQSTQFCDHIQHNIIRQLIIFLQNINGKIEIPHITLPKPQRHGDKTIITILDTINLSATHRRTFNHVRTYLQITHLSDLIVPYSNDIPICQLLHKTIPNRAILAKHKNDWPDQMLPTRKAWNIWLNILNKYFFNNLRSRFPLGEWIPTTHQPRQYHFQWYPTLNIIHDTTSGNSYHIRTIQRRYIITDPNPTTIDISNQSSIPIYPTTHPNKYHRSKYTPPTPTDIPDDDEDSFDIPIAEPIHHEMKSILDNISFIDGYNMEREMAEERIHMIEHNTAEIHIATDGSHKRHTTFGNVICYDKKPIIYTWGQADGPIHQSDIFRGEAYGIFLALLILSKFQQIKKTTKTIQHHNIHRFPECTNKTQQFRRQNRYACPH